MGEAWRIFTTSEFCGFRKYDSAYGESYPAGYYCQNPSAFERACKSHNCPLKEKTNERQK